MKKLITLITLTSIPFTAISSDTDGLKKAFHNYDITKCDSVIDDKMGLSSKSNWAWNIGSHSSPNLGDDVAEVSLELMHGSKGDSLKESSTLIQGIDKCYLHQRIQLTFSGECSDHIDNRSWYRAEEWSNLDFEKYKNAGGVDSYVKEIEVGAFKACIIEYSIRNSFPFG